MWGLLVAFGAARVNMLLACVVAADQGAARMQKRAGDGVRTRKRYQNQPQAKRKIYPKTADEGQFI